MIDVSDPIIELRRVSKSFGGQRVLDDIDLKIQRGATTAIIGRSGSGKSVLLKHVVGLLRPDRGEVLFEGRRIDGLSERELVPIRREISFVFQLNALFDSMTVGENVAFPMVHNGVGRADRRRVRELVRSRLEMVGLGGFEHKRPAELSGGEKKRVALARAIALDPELIMYDEPFAGLDLVSMGVAAKLIRTLTHVTGATSLLISHDVPQCMAISDWVVLLAPGGRVVAQGTPADLMGSDEPEVRQFVRGEPDGPVKFHYPARSVAEDFGPRASA